MASRDRVPGTYVSDKDTRELVQLLTTFREYIVSHEARLEAIEEFLNEQIKAQIALAQEIEEGTEEAETTDESEIAAAENEGLAVESTDDSSEG